MEYNVHHISAEYDFTVSGVSYIGNPRSHTVMFVTRKVSNLLENLEGISFCLVFVEVGVSVPPSIQKDNCFVFSNVPQRDYAQFVDILYKAWFDVERKRKYIYCDGYYRGENVQLGTNAYIEPGCVIGHDVIIGENASILSGTVIKRAVIGNNFLANEYAVIGASGFTMTEDEFGNKIRIPTLGGVYIGNYVEIGTHDNISSGTGSDTIIEDYVKLDAFVHIGHDAHLGKNVEITAGCVVGGYAWLGNGVYTGINSCIRNRINIGQNSIIGMGATVTKNVEPNITVAGNPAKVFEKDVTTVGGNQNLG